MFKSSQLTALLLSTCLTAFSAQASSSSTLENEATQKVQRTHVPSTVSPEGQVKQPMPSVQLENQVPVNDTSTETQLSVNGTSTDSSIHRSRKFLKKSVKMMPRAQSEHQASK